MGAGVGFVAPEPLQGFLAGTRIIPVIIFVDLLVGRTCGNGNCGGYGPSRIGFLKAKMDLPMAKEMKTRKELADLVMREARASGKCADLQSVYVIGPISNWDIGASSDSPNLVSGSCRIELNIIVGRLQATFDLSSD
jgi:hypothetical protein